MRQMLWNTIRIPAIVLLFAGILQAEVIPPPDQLVFDKTTTGTIPDLNQKRDFTGDGMPETKWCAPTASADSVWYFGKGSYPNLIPPGANDNMRADMLISILGGLMGTSDAAGGTTIMNCVNGLQNYCNGAYPGTFAVGLFTAWTFRTDLGQPSAQNLRNWMLGRLYDCCDVLPIISYGPNAMPPASEYEIFDLPLDSVRGHLVMMIGYNLMNLPASITYYDPGDDAVNGAHRFPMSVPPPVAVMRSVTPVGPSIEGTALSMHPDGVSAPYIVGAIICCAAEAKKMDFGDAPDAPTLIGYPTLLVNNGARHIVGGPWLGGAADAPDVEPDGQPTPLADGDDNDGNDDENGVKIPILVQGVPDVVMFEVSSPDGMGGIVSGWIDFNGDRIWGDTPVEKVVAGNFPDGIHSVVVTAPVGSVVGQTYARFRISRDQAAMVPTGLAQDGEVEDYLVVIEKEQQPDGLDFGDAPEGGIAYPSLGVLGRFPTCMNIGPAVWIQHNNFGAFFGPSVDFEPDGNAGLCPGFPPYDGDECFMDGDAGLLVPGVFTIVGNMVVPCGPVGPPLGQTCQTALWGPNIDIHVVNHMPNQTPGFVNVLMDWDQAGQWGGISPCPTGPAPEHVLVDWLVPNGFSGPLSVLMPPPFTIGPNAGYVWVRISITERPLGPGWTGEGIFEDGETEDYLLLIDPGTPPEKLDFGDAPDQPYPTLLVNNGARHVIVPGMFLGAAIDAEPDGQPTFPADGDDINPPGGPNDEDGVVFLTAPLLAGFPAQVQITASMNGFIDAWIDFEKNGDWAHPLEQIFSSQPVVAGLNILTFNVPVGPGGGVSSPVTYARFRYSSTGGLSYKGRAEDGEVEDYLVLVEGEIENVGDLGDAPGSTNNHNLAMTAYPGVQANFPTVYLDAMGSTPHGPMHWRAQNIAYLGASVTLEVEADQGPDQDLVNNIDPANDAADQDGADDGVLGMPLHLPYCDYAAFDYVVTVAAPGPASILYVNVWFDWNRDGDWDDVLSPVCGAKRVPEWAVQNQVLTGLVPGQHTLRTPAFPVWHPIFDEEAPEEIWMRITLSEAPWTPTPGTLGDGGSGPAAGYGLGETEDYLFVPDTSCVRCADLNCDGFVDLADFAIFASRWLATCP